MPSQAVLELMVNLKDNASSGLSSLGSAVGSLGMVAGGVALAGVAALGAAVVSGVGDAREAAKIYAQTEAVIKSTGGAAGVSAQQVADLAGSLSAASGHSLFGDDDIQQSTNLLLTFTNIKGEALDAATAISVDMAQALGGAPKDAAIQLGKALNDPIKGVTALSKVGVSFTEQQKAQIKAMQDAGNTAGAQAIILGELNKEFGGSAQAAADADGGWAQFNDRMGEAKEALGAAVLPLLGMLAGVLNDTVLPVVEAGATAFGNLVGYFSAVAEDGDRLNDFLGNLPTFMQPAVEMLGGLMAAFQTGSEAGGPIDGFINMLYSLDTISPIFDTLGDGVASLATAFSDGGIQGAIQFLIDKLAEISPAFAILKGAVDAALPPIQEIVLSVFGIISGFIEEHGAKIVADVTAIWGQVWAIVQEVVPPIQAIVASVFGAVAAFLEENGASIQAFFATTWDAIAEIVKTALAIIQAVVVPILGAIASFIGAHGAEIQAILKATWDYISGAITVALNLIQGLLKTVLLAINGDWSGAWAMLQQTSAQFVQGILDVVTKTLGDLDGVFRTVITSIKSTWDGFVSQAAAIGKNIINGIISGVQGAAGALYDTLKSMAGNALQAAKDAIGIGSPSKDFADQVGAPIIQGIMQGVQKSSGSLVAAMADLTGNLASGASDAIDRMAEVIMGADVPNSSFIGKGIIEGIMGGIKSTLPSLDRLINSTADTVEGAFQDAFGIHSPSQLFADVVGTPLIQGIAMGMQSSLPGLLDLIRKVGEDAMQAIDLQTEVSAEEIAKQIEGMQAFIADMVDKAKDLGSQLNSALAAGFSAEGSIDRQIAKNLDAMANVSDRSRRFVQSALDEATRMAAQFVDPSTGAKFLKMRSDQIFELAKIQDKINASTDAKERARLQRQYDLISAAQTAEQQAFRANDAGAESPQARIAAQIQALLSNEILTATNNPIVDQLRAMLQQVLGMGGGFAPSTLVTAAGELDSRGHQTVVNNIYLPAGTTREVTEEVMRRLNNNVNNRRS